MASGTIFSLALVQQFDDNGDPLGGCLLYTYLAGTTTPYTTFKNSALSVGQENTWPLVADASGRIPQFWLDSANTYRARLLTAEGNLIFDYDNVPAIGPGGGGGGVDTTDPNSILSTGDFKWRAVNTTLTGFVRANGRTIGSATSGATERANADCEALFLHFWNGYDNAVCPVTGGRGASAAADWAANKQIGTVDMRGRTPFGLADMGNSDSGRLDGVSFTYGSKTTAAALAGTALHTLAISEMPSHDHGAATSSDGAHTHTVAVSTQAHIAGGPTDSTRSGGTTTTSSDGAHTHTVSAQGGGGAHANMPPAILGTWFIRL